MAGERVSVIEGSVPILVIAPHGSPTDDFNTDIIAEGITAAIDCYGVINRGWCRSQIVDELNDQADCNNFSHMIGVVKDEFLDPIMRLVNRIVRNHGMCYVYMIHGMANDIRYRTGDSEIEMIIGYGAGNPPSYSCDPWRKDLFIWLLSKMNLHVYQGRAGGTMSGWARGNMNQLFRKHSFAPHVQSMQIEIIRDLRDDVAVSLATATYLADAMKEIPQYHSWNSPSHFGIKEF